jgi:hypothetical protein
MRLHRFFAIALILAALLLAACNDRGETQTPSGTPVDVTAFHGTYSVQGVATQDDCGVGTFTGSIVLSGRADGTSLIVTLTAQGFTGTAQRIYNGRMEADGTFRASGSGRISTLGGSNGSYTGTLLGKASPQTITAVESMVVGQVDCTRPSNTVTWAVNGRRS